MDHRMHVALHMHTVIHIAVTQRAAAEYSWLARERTKEKKSAWHFSVVFFLNGGR